MVTLLSKYSVSSISHVPVIRLDTRRMTGLVPESKSKLRYFLKQSTGPRYVVNPPKTPEDWIRSILGVNEVGGEVKGIKRFVLGVVTQ